MSERTFKPVKTDSVEYIRASDLKKDGITGVIVEGTFLGTVPNNIDEKKDDFKIEKEDGTVVIVNGAGNLGFSMKAVDAGDFIQINYEGMQEIAKGPHKGRQSHNFTVLKAE